MIGDLSVDLPGLPGLGRTRVLGVLNVTPDSFSDGGLFAGTEAAVRHGMALAEAGADIVDVGGESTRPGAQRVAEDEQLRRVQPVVTHLAREGIPVSIDTTRGSVARAALDAGARLVNDVSGGSDPLLVELVAESGVAFVLMHTRGTSADMSGRARYGDVVTEVAAELEKRLAAVTERGVRTDQVLVDPGIGFAKNAGHNWRLLAHLDQLRVGGRPLLVGASRKSFLGALLTGSDGQPRAVGDRDDATQALTAILAAEAVWGVRVHAARPAADAVRVVVALRQAGR